MQTDKRNYNQVRAMLAISKASLQSILRNPSAVIFTLVFPLIFIVVFGFIKGNTIKLEVGIHPQCDTASGIYTAFSETPNVTAVQKPLPEMQDLLQKGRLDALLFIHKQNGDQVVEVITSKSSREKGTFVKSLLTNIVDKKNLAALNDLKLKQQLPQGFQLTELRESEVSGREYKMIDFILPGQLGFSILSAGVFGTAFIFFSLRQTLVLKRFFATPIRRPFIILGEAFSRLVFSLLGSLIIIILGKFLFGFTLIHGFQTVLSMLLLSALGLIVFMGFGFVVSGIAKSESVIPPLANIVTLPQFLLSGTFFPVDAFPSWLQPISKALPLTYLNDALRKVAFEGAGLMAISSQLLVLLAWGTVIYLAAIKFFRWE